MPAATAPHCRFLKYLKFSIQLFMGLTWLPEGLERIQKKGKSSEFDAEDDDYIKPGPAMKV